MIPVYKYLHGEKTPGTKGLCNVPKRSIKSANGWKLKPEILKLEIRHTFTSQDN